ncbi:MAG: PaaI family thioesterase [Thermoplasmatota archaeon]
MTFYERLGVEDIDASAKSGEAVATLALDEHHLNMGGIVHGGVITSLLDYAMGAAAVSTLHDGEWCATMTLTTDFIEAVSAGKLTARARVDRRGKLAAHVSGDLYDDGGRRVARATGVWAIRKG